MSLHIFYSWCFNCRLMFVLLKVVVLFLLLSGLLGVAIDRQIQIQGCVKLVPSSFGEILIVR